jgi:hypothetical protein
MKIDVTEISHGLITSRDSLIKRDLYYDLYTQVYGKPPGPNLHNLTGTQVDLRPMAYMLRLMGWSAYYWRNRYDVTGTRGDLWDAWINYNRHEGLIIGIYCVNLTAWMLSHT